MNSEADLTDPDNTPAYPRPQLVRATWFPLDGDWDFAIEPEIRWRNPGQVVWDRRIRVPFSPETQASGIGHAGYFAVCWYRRRVAVPSLEGGRRLILRFEAVDYQAMVWINGRLAMKHEGGYTPFSCDVTHLLDGPEMEIVVRAEDDPLDLAKPRGKQDWQPEPHSIWYPRTSGIWQTVWMETVPAWHVNWLRWTANLERWEIGMEAHIGGRPQEGMRLSVTLNAGKQEIVHDTYTVVAGEVSRRVAFSDPGIDDSRNELLWSPHQPRLIDATLRLYDAEERLLDEVTSYTALRTISVQGHTVLLNGRPYPLRFVLDQGYWPETGATAPNDEALHRDVLLAKEMGFNGVRKHQKIESARYLYWADHEGLLVWEEMPSAYRFTTTSIKRLTREWMEVLDRDYSHPCIVAWVPFNESWGVPNLPDIPAQRHFVQGLYHVTKTFDSTRPVVGNDGWESVATDIIGIHDYDDDAERLESRYRAEEVLPHLFQRERPGGRILMIEGHQHVGQPIMLTEFGGIAYSPRPGRATWGYSMASSPEELARKYTALLEVVRRLPLLAGFCYTQFADTYQEANGLLYADRTPKIPIEQIATATRGARSTRQQALQEERKRADRGEHARDHAAGAP